MQKGKREMEQQKRLINSTKISIATSLAVVVGKIAFCFLSMSLFGLVSVLYSLGVGATKWFSLFGIKNAGDIGAQQRCFSAIGWILVVSNLVYAAYSLRFFVGAQPTMQFPLEVAVAIAAFTFTEITLNIRGFVAARKRGTPRMAAVKLAGISSSLIMLVFTQIALLSVSYDGDASFVNGLAGIVFGGATALIGLSMLIYNARNSKKNIRCPKLRDKGAENGIWNYS